ncbi:MAG: hypothetical protein WAN59_08960 [Candidatus Baltobacteraceae bacterium]|jgi:hypothetical protein
MMEQTDFAQALGRLHDELAGARGSDQVLAIGSRLSLLGSAVVQACERAYLELTVSTSHGGAKG